MVKYVLAARLLKMVSCTTYTKRLYRTLGNSLGVRKRSDGQMPKYYLDRVSQMLELNGRHGIPKKDSKFLELGTGWLHWEAITCRLFFDVHCTLYDVWDNRQMSGLKNYLSQLDSILDKLNCSRSQLSRAHQLIGQILETSSFEKLYDLLDFEYVVDEKGRLKQFEDNSFDTVVSGGVMEHIPEGFAAEFVQNISRLLKPGGYSFHSINLRDHLYQYDLSVSPKQYLSYSNRTWKQWYENDVQYINKIQRSDWLALFESAGLRLVEEQVVNEDISGLRIARDFQRYSGSDLECGGLSVLHTKPQIECSCSLKMCG